MMSWTPTNKDKKFGVVVYNFFGSEKSEDEEFNKFCLKLILGDVVHILEECGGWFRGYKMRDSSKKIGIFPSNHVVLKSCNNLTDRNGEAVNKNVNNKGDLVVQEAADVLREWSEVWKSLYVMRDTTKFNQLKKLMDQLAELRRTLAAGHMSRHQRSEVRMKIVDKINLGTRLLDLDIIPREADGNPIDPKTASAVHVFDMHVETAQKLLHPGERPPMAGLHSLLEKKWDLKKQLNHHLHIVLTEFSYPIAFEELEVYFSLYSSKESAYVSEKVLINPQDMAVSSDPNGAIFLDVGNLDQVRDLNLVCHVIRVGKSFAAGGNNNNINNVNNANNNNPVDFVNTSYNTLTSTMKKSFNFRRPFACSVMSIGKIITKGVGTTVDFEAKLQMGDDKDSHHLHDLILKKSTGKFSSVAAGGGDSGCVGITARLLAGEAGQVRKEQAILFKTTPEARRIGFPNVIMPGEVRNDLYVTLDRGNFERGGKTAARNIEVTAVVIDHDGRPVENCIFYSAGSRGQTRATLPVLYHNNSPIWSETLRLQVPIEKFYYAHVRIEFRHCSAKEKNEKKLMGFSFFNLMELDQTTLKDGSHTLCLYKCEDPFRLEDCSVYFTMPSKLSEVTTHEQVILSHGFVRSAKENVTVNTKLCSTKLTQNVDLMKLLNWKSSPKQLGDTLNKIMKLGGEEVVKFLQDVLDALFSMFSTEDGNSTQHSGLVFHVLVSIVAYLDDPKFENFRPVMDAYISQHFSAALVYKGLLSCVRHCADLVTSTERQEPIQKCFRSLEFISKFIIQSRQLFARATNGQNEDGFRMDVHLVFNSFNKMLSTSYEVVAHTQIIFLENISSMYPHLLREMPVIDLAKLVSLLFDSVCPTTSVLTSAKLSAIRSAINSQIFRDASSRGLLLPICCNHVRHHLLGREELRLCSDIIGDIVMFLAARKADDLAIAKFGGTIISDIGTVASIMLQPLIEVVISLDKDILSTVTGSLVSRLLGLLDLMDEQPHFRAIWDSLGGGRSHLRDFLMNTFYLFGDLVTREAYPSDWTSMRIMSSSIVLKVMQELARPLLSFFGGRSSSSEVDDGLGVGGGAVGVGFDSVPWTAYFRFGVAFVSSAPVLQLENYSEAKRSRILTSYGDMRLQMAFQLLSLWSHLGQNKLNFIPGLVGPFLEMTLIPEAELRKATLPLFFDLIEVEYNARGNFKQVGE